METIKPFEHTNKEISHWTVDKPSIIGLLIQVSITIAALIVGILFIDICRKFKWGKLIYFKRLTVLPDNTPEYKNGIIETIKHIYSVPEEWIIDNIGLDAVMFIRMFRLGVVIFAFGSIVIAPILLPVNYYAQTPNYEHYDNSTIPFLSIGLKRFSIANVPNNSNLHIIHAIFIYVFSFFVCKKLYDYYMEYLKYDYEYKKEETIRAHKERLDELTQFRTVLVQGIPYNYRTDKALKQWFIDHDIGEVESAFVMRDYDEYFIKIYNKRIKTLYALENAYCRWIEDILDYKEKNKNAITHNNNDDLSEIVTDVIDADNTETIVKDDNGKEKEKEKEEEEKEEKEKEKEKEKEEEENIKKLEKRSRTLSREPTLSKLELESLKKDAIENEEDVVAVRTKKKKLGLSSNNNSINVEDTDETTPMLSSGAVDMKFVIDSLRPKALKASSRSFVDSIDYYTEKLIKYTKIINEVRMRFYDDEDDPNVYTGTGFVTFKKQHSSTIASQVLLCSSNNTFDMICTPAPHYNDITWENLDISIKRKVTQSLILTILTVILIIFWSIPVSFISGLASLDKLESIDWLQTHFPWIFSIENLELLQTLIPPMITSIFMALAPYVFYFISSFQCFESRSAKEQSVMGKYYVFLLVNMLFVFAISNAFISFITAFIDSPMSILYTIGSLIPQGSTYFINLVAHYPVSIVTDCTKPYLPFLYWFKRKLCKTPRDFYQLKNETIYPDYCYILPPYLVIIVITVVYSIISPFILFAGLLFCSIGYCAYKYQILYFYVKEWEYYGKKWVFIHDRIVVGLLLLQVIMLGIFEVKGCYFTGISLLPAIFFTVLYYCFFKATYEKRTIHLPLDQFSSTTIDYNDYRKERGPQNVDETEEDQKDMKEMHMEEIKNSQEQSKECTTPKTPGFYQNHSYFWPMITSSLSGIWIPSKAKEVLGEDIISKIGRLPEENYERMRDQLKLTEEDIQIPYYFNDEWK